LFTVINVFDISPADDAFTKLPTKASLGWVRFSGLPENPIERHVKVVSLSRYRAAIQSARAATAGSVVISHLPLMTAAVSTALMVQQKRAPHLGFSFNFTTLPRGIRLAYLKRALGAVDQFAVFSKYEQHLYPDIFDIDANRFVPVIWTQDPPPVQSMQAITVQRPYLCAIGGEGRDFKLLVEVARRIGAAVSFVIIARPHSLHGLSIPDNVIVLTNIPLARVWRIARDSQGVLIPLKSAQTCCGHVTLVSAKLLGLPIAITRVHATREYVSGRASILECNCGDVDAFTLLVERMLQDSEALFISAQESRPREIEFHERRQWAKYLDDFFTSRMA
jgi:hypothetical protein